MIKTGGSTEHYFSSSSDDYLQRLYSKMKKDNSFITNIDEAEKTIRSDSKQILFYPSDSFKSFYKSFPCEIVASDASYNIQQWAFGFNNKSAYIKVFNYYISKGIELGLEAYPRLKDEQCTKDNEDIFRPMSFGDIFPAFVFAAMGGFIATFLCVFEYICRKYQYEY